MARQNHITIRVRYSRSKQVLTYRGVGVYGQVNMSTLSQQLPQAAITGGATRSEYWAAILNAVAARI